MSSPLTETAILRPARGAPERPAGRGRPAALAPGPDARPRGAAGLGFVAVGFALALLLPTAAAPPWALALYPTGVTFQALIMLLLVAAVWLSELDGRAARIGLSAIAAISALFTWLLLRDAVSADLLDGQPALGALWGGSGVGGALFFLAISVMAGGALGRGEAPRSRWASGLILTGLALLLAIAAGLGTADLTPAVALLGSFLGAEVLGDRVAAFAVALAVASLGPLLVLVRVDTAVSRAPALACVTLALWGLPLLLLSVFVAPLSEAGAVLAPLKVTFFTLTSASLCVRAIGGWVSEPRVPRAAAET